MAKKHIWIPAAAGGLALTLVGGASLASAMHKNDVSLVVDGVVTELSVREDSVGEVLDLQGITVGEHDVVLPAVDSEVTDGMEISVLYGRELNLTVDGEQRTVWTTARTVEEALAFLGMNQPDSKLSASRSDAIGREGLDLEITTAKNVTLTHQGQASQHKLAGTVADVLGEAGVTPDEDDIVTPAADTVLTEGLEISVVVVTQSTSTKEVEIPFEKAEEESADLAKGKKKVKTKGANGVKVETYLEVYHDGVLQNSTLQGEEITKEPVKEVTLIGTKEEKQEKKAEEPAPSNPGDESSDLTPASGNTCKASYYWQPQMTASGEQFNPNDLTAAHKTLKLGTRVKVTNPSNGKSVIVRINDRGPYIAGRCLDLSKAAMETIGGTAAGVITVNWETV
ncbi:septal ring lytic transglycosylase RlpA family protein [Arachnia propionica]|uniref:Probable endolytic peptidoglycan transglycosylase RlpA n=1 Tax=Arachnia propionica TaxID=1750 RepID=A0A3P1WT98_9ACTN|nr:septal ring lytic transglycosylase RlpA family protein [Arachnia propionica]RRD48580.1 septal ring lytic transglycosylase RlpA family protein [Arachnia propionica]